MTPFNARLFYKQFQRLMNRALEFIEAADEISKTRLALKQEQERLRPSRPRPKHNVIFMMTPFSARYQPLIAALRTVFEDQFGCQLFLASDIQYEDRILDNIRKHMEVADAFIAELTEANPNVMFELGAAYADHSEQPVIKLVDGEDGDTKPRLPADLGSMIYINYGGKQGDGLASFLRGEIRKHSRLLELLDDPSREKYISPRMLVARTRLGLSTTTFDHLAARFPTLECWKKASKNELKEILGPDAEFADFLLQRVTSS